MCCCSLAQIVQSHGRIRAKHKNAAGQYWKHISGQASAQKRAKNQTRQPKTWLPDKETPCQGRTDKPQSSTEKLPNVCLKPGKENTTAVKDGETSKLRPKSD